MQSLYALKTALPTRTGHEPSRFQHTLNALTDLTSYIATRTYDSFRRTIEPGAAPGVEEEVKREIRALKGLVLNRCVLSVCLRGPLLQSLTQPPGQSSVHAKCASNTITHACSSIQPGLRKRYPLV